MVRPLLSPQVQGTSGGVWVVFSNETDIRFLKCLKRGFRHCFVIMQQADKWVLIDPRANVTDVIILPHPVHFNLPRYFTGEGKTVCKINMVNPPNKLAPIVPFSCVEMVKRLIGLHRWTVLTPYQLYRCLTRSHTIKKG